MNEEILASMATPTQRSLPQPVCSIRVHGRAEQGGSLESWLQTTVGRISGHVAVVLDGSENMSLARSVIIRCNGPTEQEKRSGAVRPRLRARGRPQRGLGGRAPAARRGA